MKANDSFESKIRSKLDSYEFPYDKSFWNSYLRKYGSSTPKNIFKIWYVPYIFSGLLFAILFFSKWPKLTSNQLENHTLLFDTLYSNEVITRVDTVFIYDTVFVKQSVIHYHTLSSAYNQSQNDLLLLNNQNQEDVGEGFVASQQSRKRINPNVKTLKRERPLLGGNVSQIDSLNVESSQILSANTNEDSIKSNRTGYKTTVRLDSTESNLQSHQELLERRSLALNWASGPDLGLFLPFSSNNLDTYLGVFLGYGVSLQYNRLELYSAAQLGFMQYEVDDLYKLSQDSFHSIPNLNIEEFPEDIEIISTNIHLPIILGYEILNQNRFSLFTKFGVLGNILLSESFEYSFDNFERDNSFTIRNADVGLIFSHAIGGLDLRYTFNDKLDIAIASQYYFPLTSIGTSRINSPSLMFQMRLLKRL
jgi:hypothetical protein